MVSSSSEVTSPESVLNELLRDMDFSMKNESVKLGSLQEGHSHVSEWMLMKRLYSCGVIPSHLMCAHLSHWSHCSARWLDATGRSHNGTLHGCLTGPGLVWIYPESSSRATMKMWLSWLLPSLAQLICALHGGLLTRANECVYSGNGSWYGGLITVVSDMVVDLELSMLRIALVFGSVAR